jgi:hypothetical protein
MDKPTWTEETMNIINKLTPDIKGKAFDPDWFLLRQRFEEFEGERTHLLYVIDEMRQGRSGCRRDKS